MLQPCVKLPLKYVYMNADMVLWVASAYIWVSKVDGISLLLSNKLHFYLHAL